jgi:hypothetical protein
MIVHELPRELRRIKYQHRGIVAEAPIGIGERGMP